MSQHAPAWQTVALTVLLVALVPGWVALSLAAANLADLPGPGPRLMTRINLGYTLAVAALGIAFFAALTAAGVSDWRAGRPHSPLYWPLEGAAAFLCAIGCVLAVGAADRLTHNLTFGWHLTDDPDLLSFNSTLILGAYVAIGAAAAVILRGRGWPLRVLVTAAAAIVAGTLAVIGAAFWVAV